MKIIVGEEHVIVQGMRPEENWWGKYQFPIPYHLGDRILVKVHVEDDDWYYPGIAHRWFESCDEGISWQEIDPKTEYNCGILLPNGDRYYLLPGMGEELKDYVYEDTYYLTPDYDFKKRAPEGVIPIQDGMTFWFDGSVVRAYLAERLPKSLDRRFWEVKRIPKGETEPIEEKAEVEWKGLTRVIRFPAVNKYEDGMLKPILERKSPYEGGVLKPIAPRGNPKVGPDGAIWVTSFSGEGHVDPETGQYNPYYSAEIFRSDDNGKSFEHRSHMEYPADGHKYPYKSGGFSDSDIAFMADGSMVWFLRSAWACATCQNWDPMYMSRSYDMGKTWSKPEVFAETGILPRLCQLDCGVTLLCYARPGMYLAATKDGYEWEKVTVMKAEDRSHLANDPIDKPFWHQWDGACGNPEMIPIDDHSALLVYGDFTIRMTGE